MLDAIDRRVEAFVKQSTDASKVSFMPPSKIPEEAEANVYLLELAPPEQGRFSRDALELRVRYLITVQDADPHAAHARMGNLMFAAMASEEWDAELSPLPAATWTALGAPPQPALLLETIARLEKPARTTRRVRSMDLRLEQSHVQIWGQVITPEGVPVMRAEVTLVELNARTQTDHEGRFAFSNAPSQPKMKTIRVRAKGYEAQVQTEGGSLEVRIGPED